eukprot:TRINITY_DN4256_c0_g1_i10.p1 TRINITY_DN4256_c0_g1~~TRINITY_DN4256_c0_g1_i10.p1  ORF type:complete len:209 (+),score=-15.63 TRINITY_DN4256_c0_g1_i10:196-822(+)
MLSLTILTIGLTTSPLYKQFILNNPNYVVTITRLLPHQRSHTTQLALFTHMLTHSQQTLTEIQTFQTQFLLDCVNFRNFYHNYYNKKFVPQQNQQRFRIIVQFSTYIFLHSMSYLIILIYLHRQSDYPIQQQQQQQQKQLVPFNLSFLHELFARLLVLLNLYKQIALKVTNSQVHYDQRIQDYSQKYHYANHVYLIIYLKQIEYQPNF